MYTFWTSSLRRGSTQKVSTQNNEQHIDHKSEHKQDNLQQITNQGTMWADQLTKPYLSHENSYDPTTIRTLLFFPNARQVVY